MKRLLMICAIIIFLQEITLNASFFNLGKRFANKEFVHQFKKCGGLLFDVASELSIFVCGLGYAKCCFDRYMQQGEKDKSYFKWLGILAFCSALKGLRMATISGSKLIKTIQTMRKVPLKGQHKNNIIIPTKYHKRRITTDHKI